MVRSPLHTSFEKVFVSPRHLPRTPWSVRALRTELICGRPDGAGRAFAIGLIRQTERLFGADRRPIMQGQKRAGLRFSVVKRRGCVCYPGQNLTSGPIAIGQLNHVFRENQL